VFDWKKMVENESCLNTPPVYAIYMAGLCFDWLVPLLPGRTDRCALLFVGCSG
jgi:hypothetical protein